MNHPTISPAKKKSRFVSVLITLALISFLSSYAFSADINRQTKNPEGTQGGAVDYVIGPQNVIQIKIFGDASANQIYRVDELGTIKHALIGSVKVAGLSVSEAEKLIETKLKGDYFIDPRVTIFVLEQSRFSVLGEVRKPGIYEIQGKVSVIEAISMAGGFTPVANQRDVKIIRKTDGRESTITVDATRITSGDLDSDIAVEADDVINVTKSFF